MEKSSTNKRKYCALVVKWIGDGPYKSVWIKANGWGAQDSNREKGNLWLFANWQVEQISCLWYWWEMLQEWRAFIIIVANGCPSLECQSTTKVLEFLCAGCEKGSKWSTKWHGELIQHS